MKKIIPLIFAVLPMMSAMADIPLFETQEGQVASSTTIASTSYVDGAYNALGTAINGVTSDKQAKSDSRVVAGENETLNYISEGTGVASNLKALDAQVKTVTDKVGTIPVGESGNATAQIWLTTTPSE